MEDVVVSRGVFQSLLMMMLFLFSQLPVGGFRVVSILLFVVFLCLLL